MKTQFSHEDTKSQSQLDISKKQKNSSCLGAFVAGAIIVILFAAAFQATAGHFALTRGIPPLQGFGGFAKAKAKANSQATAGSALTSGPNTPALAVQAAAGEPNKPAPVLSAKAPVPAPPVQAPQVQAETGAADSVAVTVNGVDINESRIEAQLKPQLAKVGAQLPSAFVEQYKNQLRQQVLEGMIVEQLLDGKVKENNIIVTEEEVVGHLEKAAAQQNLSLADIKEMMEARGQSFDEAKQRIKKGMAYQKLMDTQWAGKINVTEDDAKKYYSENKTKFETPEQVRASHILIKPDTNQATAGSALTSDPNADPNQAKAKAKAKAEDLLKQIKGGADFAELAKTNSGDTYSAIQGGDLGFFGRSQMVPAFERAAFALKAGQVSDVVETQFGYHIIKLTDHKDANTIPFEQAKDDIVKLLTQTKQAEFAEEYINSLKANAKIVYPPGKEPNAPAAGPATTAKPRPDNKPVPEPKEKTSVKKKTSVK
jgi:peptidyl-prolyl cis-trans isomerase C